MGPDSRQPAKPRQVHFLVLALAPGPVIVRRQGGGAMTLGGTVPTDRASRTDWVAVAAELAPAFAARAAAHDADDRFVFENYAELRRRRVFSAGVPAELFSTMAVYDDPMDGPTVIHFVIALDTPGVKVHDNWRTLGMRATGSNDVTLDNVFVPEAAVGVRRPSGRWSHAWHVVATTALPIIYSVYVGVAEAARDVTVREAARRRDDHAVQELVGAMDTELAAARLAWRSMVEAANRGRGGPDITTEVMIGRTLVGHSVLRTVETAMEAAGGAAFFRSAGLERLFRDAQGARYHALRGAAQRRLAGRLALGVDIDG